MTRLASTSLAAVAVALSLSSSNVAAIPLLNGRFETTTDVQPYLDLAFDVADMKEATNTAKIQSIYENGGPRQGQNATQTGKPITLQSLSLDANHTMAQSPMFNIFRYAFWVLGNANEGDTIGNFDGHPVDQYANTIVNDLFSMSADNLETEAALVTSVWMAVVDNIFQVLKECKASNASKGLAALDRAAALWIGAGQKSGSNEEGDLLYNLAENAGQRFGQDNGETVVNTEFVNHLVSVQSDLKNKKCNTIQGYTDMRKIVKRMVGLMTVPLVQNMIHYSKTLQSAGTSSSFVELYALATIPRVAACDPAAYEEELKLDVLRELKPYQVDMSIAALQEAYSCLYVTCADVGSYLGGVVPACVDNTTVSIAGYTTSRVGAQAKSDLDRDIKAIDIFLQFEAYGAAGDWYTYGWNADGYTLQALAKNQLIPALPSGNGSYVSIFQDYYSETNFADNLITNVLALVPPYNSASKDQVRNMVTGLLKYVVMFMTSATSLQYAVELCDTNMTGALGFWDTGALFFTGSMEGPNEDGSAYEGEFLFSTAKDLCADFETCTMPAIDNGNVAVAAVNGKIIEGLNKVVSAISGGSCSVAKSTLESDILPAMIVPLIQGTIKYASYNAGLQTGSTDSSLAIGDTFARGVLPIVALANASSASTIMSNMEFQLSSKPVSKGFSALANAMRTALKEMPTSCSDVGALVDEPSDGDMCPPGTPEDTASVKNLAWGRYTFQNLDAAQDSTFALDVRDMQQGSLSQANTTYFMGKNVQGDGLYGYLGVTTLSELSVGLAGSMKGDVMFSLYRYALYLDKSLDNPDQVYSYGNDVVETAITQGKDNVLAAESAVVMNVWMVVLHRLYEAERACRDHNDPVPYIDSAVALWIGKGQKEGKYDQGSMIYAVAQTARKAFGFQESEATINTVLMQKFNQLQKSAAACTTEQDQLDFYFKSRELIHALSKPLILAFIGHIFTATNYVELYGVAVLPQAYACDKTIGDTMEHTFVQQYSKDKLTTEVKDHFAAFLRCQRVTADDLAFGASVGADIKDFLQSMYSRLNSYTQTDKFLPMAGYEPNSDVYEMSRMDLDAELISIMVKVQSFDAAKEIFQYGLNSYAADGSGYNSFQSLLNYANASDFTMFQIYSDFYSSDTYAADLFFAALEPMGSFAGISRLELGDVVFRIMQSVVSYITIFSKMEEAATSCDQGNITASQHSWDSAAALFIGSVEGLLPGGVKAGEGNFLYGMSKEICGDFVNGCGTSETPLNERLILQFGSGRDAVPGGMCDFLRRVATNEIGPSLATLLVQGILSFSLYSENSGSGNYESYLAGAYGNAKAVIPLVSKVNSTSTSTLENIYGNFSSLDAQKPMKSIRDALAYALRGMNVDCQDVGTPVDFPSYSLCLGNITDEVPIADTPTDLGNGLYVTTTYVQDRADIAKDIADISGALSSNNVNLAKMIYQDGKNSEIYNEKGKFVSLRSLESFSIQDTSKMLDEPLFNIFMYALRDSNGKFMSKDVRYYADTIVEDAFNNATADRKLLPVEAALALNLWMEIAHVLYTALEECRKKEITNRDGIQFMDIAVAYWIGDGQVAGSGNNGHLLYAFAERMGTLFNMDQGGQSRTNTNILKLFNEAKSEISMPGACSNNPSSYLHLSRLTTDITSLMAVPLIQSLIHSLRTDDRARVKLYANAVVPLAAPCAPGAFEYLKAKLLKMTYNVVEIEKIIASIRSIYPCLGLTCADIGVHTTEKKDPTQQCKDPGAYTSLAGYKPASDVGEFSRLDLDIRELDILLMMKAYAAAENLYTYGKHVTSVDAGSISLFLLATTPERKIVPEYDAFIRYYGNVYQDPSYYADNIIRSAFNNTGGEQWTDAQRRIVVLKSVQVLVMYFGALQPLFQAVSECGSSSSAGSAGYSDQWDRGAAFLIGSLEGNTTNGTQIGYMYYDLAQDYCKDFGTCVGANGGVTTNEQLVSLLYTGRGAALSNSCSGVSKAAREIASLILVPVIQGALYSATQLAKSNAPDAELRRAEGYVYSRAILPLVANVNWGASEIINTDLGFPGPKNTHKTASDVFSALAIAYPKMGVDCELIGRIGGNDPCKGVVYKKGIGNLPWIIVGSVLGACALCGCFMLQRRHSRTKKLPENNPRFIIPETGELNHSMDLLEKAFSSKSHLCASSGETVALAEDMHYDASTGDDDDFEEVTALTYRMDSPDADII